MAVRLAEVFDEMLHPIEKVLSEFEHFDPTRYQGEIAIVIDPILMDEQGAHLLSHCYAAFPKASFSFSHWSSYSQDEMLEGQHDYCILDQETQLSQDIYMRPLYREKRVILARDNHPVLVNCHQWKTVATLPLVTLPSADLYKPLCTVESEYQRMGYEPKVQLKSYNLRVAHQMLLQTDAILFASESTAKLMPGISCYDMPPVNDAFRQFVVSGGFLQVNRNHPLHLHLHEVMMAAFANGPGKA